MAYKVFYHQGGDLDELSNFLSDPKIRIIWKHANTMAYKHDNKVLYRTIFYVFYNDVKEELRKEQSVFTDKLETAKEVSMDERYFTLKNARQRELFLLHEHFVPREDAQDVMELLKPEMARIIRDSAEIEEEV